MCVGLIFDLCWVEFVDLMGLMILLYVGKLFLVL